LPRRRDRRFHPRQHQRGRRERGRARHPRRRRARGGELRGRRCADDDRPPPGLGGVPRRRHRLARPRAARPPRQRLVHRRLRLAQRHLRQPRADRLPAPGRRRRAPGRQIQAHVPGAMSTVPTIEGPEPKKRPAAKPSTIGAVCKALSAEFPDISISKIRYLEDQRLLTPRRTPGGYRLYTANDVSRLRTILRLQRDEFLPLRVIRQELATHSPDTAEASTAGGETRRRWRPNVSVIETNSYFTLEDVLEETKAEPKPVP